MNNVLLDNKNRLYVHNEETWQNACKKQFLIGGSANVRTIPNGIVLPIRDIQGKKNVGGVCDSNFNFVAGLHRIVTSEGKLVSAYGGVQDCYKVPQSEIEYVDETVVFGGVFIAHFGHMLQDNLSRLWWHVKNTESNLKFVFVASKGTVKSYFYDILHLLDIDDSRIIFVTKPTQYKSVIVPDETIYSLSQCRAEWQLPYDYIINKIKNNVNLQELPSKVYFTKTKVADRSVVVNEEYFENYYASQGYAIISPEQYPIEQQLAFVVNADCFAATMGTTSLFLMFGKNGARAEILARTEQVLPGQLMMFYFRQMDWYIIDVSANLFFGDRGIGPHLASGGACWQKFVKQVYNQDIEIEDIPAQSIKKYIKEWTTFYINNAQSFKDFKWDRYDLFDVLNKSAEVFYQTNLQAKDYRAVPSKATLQKQIESLKLASGQTKSVEEPVCLDVLTELNDIKNSRSYKLGRFLTLIPRKMRESAQKRKQKRLLRKQAKQSQTKGKAQ